MPEERPSGNPATVPQLAPERRSADQIIVLATQTFRTAPAGFVGSCWASATHGSALPAISAATVV
jgi:hypothetical protein